MYVEIFSKAPTSFHTGTTRNWNCRLRGTLSYISPPPSPPPILVYCREVKFEARMKIEEGKQNEKREVDFVSPLLNNRHFY